MLRLLIPLAEKNETQKSHVALLYDRVQIHKGLPQKYGSQGRCKGHYQWVPFKLENPSKLEEYRKSMGLPTMAKYIQEVKKLCI